MRCSIFSCLSDWHQDFIGPSLHRFPKNPEHCQRWVDALSRAGARYTDGDSARICSLHFKEDDFRKNNVKWTLKKSAVPTLNLVDEAGKSPTVNLTGRVCPARSRVPLRPINNPTLKTHQLQGSTATPSRKLPTAIVDINFRPQVRNAVTNAPEKTISNLFHGSDQCPPFATTLESRQWLSSTTASNRNRQVAIVDINFRSEVRHESTDTLRTINPNLFVLPSNLVNQSVLPPKNVNVQTQTESEPDQIRGEQSQSTLAKSPVAVASAPLPEKRIRYAGDIKDVSSLSGDAAKQALPKVLEQLHRSQQRTNRLKQQNIVLRKTNGQFSTIIADLKARNLINSKGEVLLQRYETNCELLKELCAVHRGIAYSDTVRAFATTLCFYSPKAYRFVRASLNNGLPTEKTVATWYRVIDGEPGITAEALNVLESKSKAMALEDRKLMVSVSMDEVAIRQLVEWNPHRKKFDGVVSYGDALSFLCDGGTLVPAKEALVFMVSSIEEDWKIPVAYFLICGLKTDDKKVIVENVLTALEDVGVKVIGFTFDGTSTNFSVANALGCNLKINDEPFITHFQHPSGMHRVYVFLDACHMLKLVRNILASQSVLRTVNGEVKWEFIKQLNDFQNLTGLKLAPQLSNQHINFQNQKMKVLLAVQALSKRVSEALMTLKLHDPAFNEADATAEFISLINSLFDVMNSKDLKAAGLKQPLSRANFEEVEAVFQHADIVIRSIHLLTGQSVLQSQSKTGFLGFLIDMQSFLEMYKELVVELEALEYIRTYRFSQDHLETFFAAVRAKGGSNNNPSATQFKAAYKRLLTHNNVTAPAKANCMDTGDTTILNVTPGTSKLRDRSSIGEVTGHTNAHDEVEEMLANDAERDDFVDENLRLAATEKTVEFVRKEILRTMNCRECLNILKCHDTSNRLIAAFHEVFEQQFNKLVKDRTDLDVAKYYNVLVDTTVEKLRTTFALNDFGKHLHNGTLIDHKSTFIRGVVVICLNMRFKAYSKTVRPFKPSTRSKYTKLILFEGH